MQPYRTLQYSLQNDHEVKSAPLKNNPPPKKNQHYNFPQGGIYCRDVVLDCISCS